MDAGIQSLMWRGAAQRALFVGGVLALALVAAGCFIAESPLPGERVTHAEIVEYADDVLVVRAVLEPHEYYEGQKFASAVSTRQACVEARSLPCFYDPADEIVLRNEIYLAESARIISGFYVFGFTTGPPEDRIAWSCSVRDAQLEICEGESRRDQTAPLIERQEVDFDFAELNELGSAAGLLPSEAVQVLFRFRIPGLEQGETVRFFGESNDHPSLNRGAITSRQ